MSRLCLLKCLIDSHPPIELPDNEETIVGRSKITKIKDQACSRNQISLRADYENSQVEIKPLGVNPSGLDGFAMKKDAVYKVGHGSRIEILLNNYIHLIEFDPAPGGKDTPVRNKRKLEESSPAPAKKMYLKPVPLKEATESSWEDVDRGELYVYTSKGVKPSSKIAAFDMDGTLIKTKSGKIYPVDTHDWQIAFPPVHAKLYEYYLQDYKIVILSNQAPIGNGRVKIEDFKIKVEDVVEKLNVPVQAYLATGKGMYRKPATGMWKALSEKFNDGINIDMEKSFYVGDAAGRAANWAPGKKKDHSMADKLLAENLGLTFFTPEQFFLGHSISNVPMCKPAFDPRDCKTTALADDDLISKEQEILVLVGFPASGKSHLSRRIAKCSNNRYVTVCRDVLGSWQKCAAEASKLLKQGKSVIVDSTNPDVESRARWTSLAKESRVTCRCAKLKTSMAHAQHNNRFRELMKINHVPVNNIVFHTYKNKFTEPTTSEGFKEVIQVEFNPNFEDAEAEKLYRMHLLEK